MCSFVLQGAGIAAQGLLVSVYFRSGDAYGFAALILGVAFKSGELPPPRAMAFSGFLFFMPPAESPLPGEACTGLGCTREHESCKRLSPLCAASQEVPLIVKNH